MSRLPPQNDAGAGGQRWDPDRYRRNASFVSAHGEPVLALLAPRPGERILDLGCGEGTLAAKIAAAGAEVLGVDASPEQVAACRARGIEARVMDGARLGFAAAFDAVFSNAALHWMRDLDAVTDGVWRALKPGGRFVAECGGAGNVATVRAALMAAMARRGIDGAAVDPWHFPSPEEQRARLERHGFRVREMALLPRPTVLPGRLADWLETFGENFLGLLSEAEQAALKSEMEEQLQDRLCDAAGVWTVDYVRLRFAADKPADTTKERS
ncbi:MAG TPA: class I SAM-dependent methyltransferase [Stellaceae bacterium]|nr:class I SAM-dependent methyltransferase [Stellaceae bacterium]